MPFLFGFFGNVVSTSSLTAPLLGWLSDLSLCLFTKLDIYCWREGMAAFICATVRWAVSWRERNCVGFQGLALN